MTEPDPLPDISVPKRHLPPIGAERVAAFAAASGDDNPLHLDTGLARRLGFDAPPVHGMLLVALIEETVRTAIPHGTILAQSTRFLAPVPAAAPLTIEGRVVRRFHTGSGNHAILRVMLHAVGERPSAMAEVEIGWPDRATG